jgi:hypothetical protein
MKRLSVLADPLAAWNSAHAFPRDIACPWPPCRQCAAQRPAAQDRSSTSVATGYTTSQRPNRVPGNSLTPAGGQGIRNWINPAAFALVSGSGYGTAPRNLARGSNLWQADIGLAKRILISERAELQFRSEFFNLFNRAQYGQPLADFSAATFGQIIGTANPGPVGTGTPRQMQFALRLEF